MNFKFYFLIAALLAILAASGEAARPAHCLEPHPTGTGPCRMVVMGFFFNPASSKCEQWLEGGCDVEGGHSYNSAEECEQDCVNSA